MMPGLDVSRLLLQCFTLVVLLKLTTLPSHCEAAGSSSANITFFNQPADKETDQDGFIMFLCAVDNVPPNHHLVWTRNDRPVLQDNEPIDDDIPIRIRGVGAGPSSNLVINQVSAEDHGSFFSCRVYNGSLLGGGRATLVLKSRSAVLTVIYPPSSKYPRCRVNPEEKDGGVSVMLSCCTEIVSVPLSLSWVAQGENSSWRITQQASTWHERGQDCINLDIHTGLNFSMYQCKLSDASEKLRDFKTKQCKIQKLSSASISLKYLNHKNAQFNCTMQKPGNYQYLWHLQDEEMKRTQQISSLSTEPILVLPLSKVSNGSLLSCSIFDGFNMGTTDLKIVLSAALPGDGVPSIVIIGVVIGAVVVVLIVGLSTYFLMVKWRRRNERLYASLERGSETGMHVAPGSAYTFFKNGPNGNTNGTVVTAEGGRLEMGAEEVPPKPGGHRTISWEPEDIIIRSNGGVINKCEDPKKRNVEGLVYADLAFQGVEEEQDAEVEEEEGQEDAEKGAVGGNASGAKPGVNGQNNIEYASIVPPPRSLRF